MPFNIFRGSQNFKVHADEGTTIDSEDDSPDSDEAYYSLDEVEDSDDECSSVEISPPSTNDHDHNQNADFVYGPINQTSQVRLLRIRGATKRSVEAQLIVVDVAKLSMHNYYALSYTWGKPRTDQDVHPIKVGGKKFYIRNNLWNFFLSGGDQLKKKDIYIDAICTNQRDFSERGHQVKSMAEIYAKADNVIVWLGNPLPSQRRNLKALQRRLSKLCPTGNWDLNAMYGLAYVCSSRYWTRLWIVQELLLARNVMIRFGDWLFDWDSLAELQRVPLKTADLDVHKKLNWWDTWVFREPESYTQQATAEDNISKDWENALRIFHHRSKWKQRMIRRARSTPGGTSSIRDGGLPLCKAVDYFSGQQCQDPRDKIYALLGLLEAREKDQIAPSYESNDRYEVYTEALTICVLGIQRDLEPSALQKGYYPHAKYRECAATLCRILELDSQSTHTQAATMKAFKTKTFRDTFIKNLRIERGEAWLAYTDHSPTEIESSIFYEFTMLTAGKESGRKVFGLRLAVQGKIHLPSAALTAARSGYFNKTKFVNSDEQGFTFRMVATAAKIWEGVVHFRRWSPFGN